jgi:heat shock protein HslJ
MIQLNNNPPIAEAAITIQFNPDGKVSGSDGCNTYNTTYALNGANLALGKQIAATKKACSEPIMTQAIAYLQALPNTATYELTGNQLRLRDSTGKTLAAFTAQAQALAKTTWQVSSYNNGKQAVVSVLNGTTLTVEFDEDGKLKGTGGCNSYAGSYKLASNKISIGALNATLKACLEPKGLMEQEAHYLAALASADTFTLSGYTLEMRTVSGALAATFTRVP